VAEPGHEVAGKRQAVQKSDDLVLADVKHAVLLYYLSERRSRPWAPPEV
jgi:hypothetical protein